MAKTLEQDWRPEPEHTGDLNRLNILLDGAAGRFALIVAGYDQPLYRDRLIASLAAHQESDVLDASTMDSVASLEEHLQCYQNRTAPLHLIGLDQWLARSPERPEGLARLQGLNRHRDYIAKLCQRPLILWLLEYQIRDLSREAADLWEWRSGTFDFLIRRHVAAIALPQRIDESSASQEERLARIAELRNFLRQYDSQLGDRERAAVWEQQGDLLRQTGDWPAAQEAFAQARAAYERLGDRSGAAQILAKIADIHWRQGNAEQALTELQNVQEVFETLGDGRSQAVTQIKLADTLMDLGRLNEAVLIYRKGIAAAESLGDTRLVAVGKGNLGTVCLMQGDYAEALKAHEEARDLFSRLGEPASVATAWHQIGMVHETANQFDKAESAYRQSLAMKIRANNRAGKALTLGQLGNLYDRMSRLEEAVCFYRQAAEIYAEPPQDQRYEGVARSNIANTLVKLGRLDEARTESLRAIECKKPFDHAAKPWTTWGILHALERAAGNPEAANQARQQAMRLFRDYRLAGGENHNAGGKLCQMVAQAIQAGETAELAQILAKFQAEIDKPWAKALIPKLQAVLQGSRDQALAEDPDLDYTDAVELGLLLRHLAGQG